MPVTRHRIHRREPPGTLAWTPSTRVVADAHFLPLRSGCVDALYASHVIEHLDEPARFLKEVKRVLRPGARAHVRTPNFLSPNARADPDHKHVFTFISLYKMARDAGLTPHFRGLNISPRLPGIIHRVINLIALLLSDELYLMAEKPAQAMRNK